MTCSNSCSFSILLLIQNILIAIANAITGPNTKNIY